jgi:hypothetical protein
LKSTTIAVPETAAEAIARLARAELRAPRQQAVILVLEALTARAAARAVISTEGLLELRTKLRIACEQLGSAGLRWGVEEALGIAFTDSARVRDTPQLIELVLKCAAESPVPGHA